MGYFLIFSTSAIISLSLIASGKIFNNIFLKSKSENIFEIIIFGIILNSFLALLINFIFSLNKTLNLIFIIFPILYYFLFIKNNYKKELFITFIISLISVLLVSLENTNRPDAGLYHLPFINILNESNLIVGISNLHFRYGHISILQYLSAIYNNSFFGSNGILIPPVIVFLSLSGYLLHNTTDRENDKFIKYISFIYLSYCLINMNRYSSWGNDDFASILFFICLIESYRLYLNYNSNSFSKLVLFCSFAFLIKSTFIIAILIPIFILFKFLKNFKLNYIFNSLNYFTFFFILFWLFKNFLNSSCILFPLEFTCFQSFDWSLKIDAINNISLITEAWAKDFPNYKNESNITYKEYISNFIWIKTWLNNHFIVILKNILLLVPLSLLGIVFFELNLNTAQKKFINHFFLILVILTLIWFYKFPLLRFGEGILVSLILFLLINFKKLKFNIIKINNIKFIILLIFIFGVITKNGVRIYNNYNYKYLDYPWPKKNSYTKENNLIDYIAVKKDNEIIYYETKIDTDLCMYGKGPCASLGVNESFFKKDKILIKKDKFFVFDSFVIKNK